jgi:HD-like signal output (HDOD) protein
MEPKSNPLRRILLVDDDASVLAPDCALAAVVHIIERDVGLCAKVLQLVNSAFFGMSRRIASLSEAVTYLGTLTAKNLAMAHASTRAEGGGSTRGLERKIDS